MFSTPTVAGDLLFVGSCSGMFYAFNKNTGQPQWSYDIKADGKQANFHGDPLVTEDLVIIGTDGLEIGHIYAFERATGKVRWKHARTKGSAGIQGVNTDILRLGSKVYGVALGDELVCLDLESGHPIWTFPSGFQRNEQRLSQAPAVGAGRVFFGGLDGIVYALDANSGKLIWKRDLGAPVSTHVTLLGDGLYVGAASHLYRLNRKTGAVTTEFAAEGKLYGKPTIAGDSLLVFVNWLDSDSELISLDLSLKKVRWRQKSEPASWSSPRPYIVGSTAIVGNNIGEVFAFRLTDGSQQWSHKFKGEMKGIGNSEGVLYVGALKGMIYAYSPERQATQ